MSGKTGIEWTDATWNPIRGCSRVSEGCRNCYAESMAARFSDPGMPYHGLAERKRVQIDPSDVTKGFRPEARWTGKIQLVREHLEDPLQWKRPRRIFVNSMSDLFHEGVREEWLHKIFDTMSRCPQHTFQILTKRSQRMADYLNNTVLRWAAWQPFLLPNVWLGVSMEDQKTADERIAILLKTPAAVRWVSYEPALGPVTFNRRHEFCPTHDFASGFCAGPCEDKRVLNWVVVGGESGPGARPFFLDWARDTVRQCREAGIPVFVKQLGKQPVVDRQANFDSVLKLYDRKGGDWEEWPEDLRIREYPVVKEVAKA